LDRTAVENRPLQVVSIRKGGSVLLERPGGKVIEVEFERGFVTLVFDSEPPRFFKQTEIPEELLRKLTSVTANQFLNVLCVHSFYRDDWQARYDEDLAVTHKLLDIIVMTKDHAKIDQAGNVVGSASDV
jgi:hypothetical protein